MSKEVGWESKKGPKIRPSNILTELGGGEDDETEGNLTGHKRVEKQKNPFLDAEVQAEAEVAEISPVEEVPEWKKKLLELRKTTALVETEETTGNTSGEKTTFADKPSEHLDTMDKVFSAWDGHGETPTAGAAEPVVTSMVEKPAREKVNTMSLGTSHVQEFDVDEINKKAERLKREKINEDLDIVLEEDQNAIDLMIDIEDNTITEARRRLEKQGIFIDQAFGSDGTGKIIVEEEKLANLRAIVKNLRERKELSPAGKETARKIGLTREMLAVSEPDLVEPELPGWVRIVDVVEDEKKGPTVERLRYNDDIDLMFMVGDLNVDNLSEREAAETRLRARGVKHRNFTADTGRVGKNWSDEDFDPETRELRTILYSVRNYGADEKNLDSASREKLLSVGINLDELMTRDEMDSEWKGGADRVEEYHRKLLREALFQDLELILRPVPLGADRVLFEDETQPVRWELKERKINVDEYLKRELSVGGSPSDDDIERRRQMLAITFGRVKNGNRLDGHDLGALKMIGFTDGDIAFMTKGEQGIEKKGSEEKAEKNTGLVWYEGILDDLKKITAPNDRPSEDDWTMRKKIKGDLESKGIKLPPMSVGKNDPTGNFNREKIRTAIEFLEDDGLKRIVNGWESRERAIAYLESIGIGKRGVEFLPDSPMAKAVEQKTQKPVEEVPEKDEYKEQKLLVAKSLRKLTPGSEDLNKVEFGFLGGSGVNVNLVEKLLIAKPELLVTIADIYERAIKGEAVNEEEVADIRELVAILGLRW